MGWFILVLSAEVIVLEVSAACRAFVAGMNKLVHIEKNVTAVANFNIFLFVFLLLFLLKFIFFTIIYALLLLVFIKSITTILQYI